MAVWILQSQCHDVCMWVCMLAHDKMKTPDWNDLKLGTVEVLGSPSSLLILGSKWSRVGHSHHFKLMADPSYL